MKRLVNKIITKKKLEYLQGNYLEIVNIKDFFNLLIITQFKIQLHTCIKSIMSNWTRDF